MRRKHITKDAVLNVINRFHIPSRMSWIIKAFNRKGIIPSESEIRKHIENLENEGKICVTKNVLGNAEYAPKEVNDGKEKEEENAAV